MNDNPCPEDVRLWPVILEGTADPELQHHLDQCAVCAERLQSLREVVHAVRGIDWENSNTTLLAPPAGPLPEKIGEFPILARLGSGGQAEVYRAWHPRLKTDVVIKWFRTDAFAESDPPQLTSLVQTLSSIRHPNLGQLYDVGTEQGRHYLVMEYIKGHVLSAWIRKFKPTIAHIAAVLSKAALAVDAVHKQGALHLDLKPGNIMIDDQGDPRVIDFGMVQLQGHGERRSLLLAPGTPEFMSPEQYAGDSDQISIASDVYGLGAVLYTALSERPIRTSEQMRLEPDWTFIRHAPWRLRRICHKALSVRPQDRFESALAMAEDLERFAERHTRLRRALSAALILLGTGSCLWGGLASNQVVSKASLVIEDQRQIRGRLHSINEMKCAAILSNHRLPCLMITTATTVPATVSQLLEEADADLRIAKLRSEDSWIRIAGSAGPHLVLACAKRDWIDSSTDDSLSTLLKSLQEFPLQHQIEILVSQDKVQLLTGIVQSLPAEEMTHHQTILKKAALIQQLLNQRLPYYSGVLVIPTIPVAVASGPVSLPELRTESPRIR